VSLPGETKDPRPGGPRAPEAFLREVVVPAFNAETEEIRRRVAALESELADRLEVEAAVALHVRGEQGGRWYLNVRGGCMEIGAAATAPVVFSVHQSVDDWEAFAGQAVAPGGGGSMAAPRGVFTRSRVARLRTIVGTVRILLKIDGDGTERAVVMHFGPGEPGETPDVTVSMREADALLLRTGELDPPAAFLRGLVTMSGDVGLAVQIGTALFL
jgi:hypothetical protein